MFQSRLNVEDIPPNLWVLLRPLVWEDEKYGRVEFPPGTVTDLGSTPQHLRRFRIFDPTGPSRRAAVGHDALYKDGFWPDGRRVTREVADRFLFDAMRAEGIHCITCWLWYQGVRLGGWIPWGRYREQELER